MMWIRQKLIDLDLHTKVSHGLIETAYANGSVGRFLEDRGIKRVIVPTGVKYATPEQKKFTIGANDEPNGHGTILVNWQALDAALNSLEDPMDYNAQKLRTFLKIPSQTVGCGIANMLMMEAVMRDLDMNVKQVIELYTENPSVLTKAEVKDRTSFKTTWDEQRLVEPFGLQDFIDTACKNTPCGRCFVRPSGTEDILRVYAEAKTPEDAD
jgi:phosphoacetylglucosamine mutase